MMFHRIPRVFVIPLVILAVSVSNTGCDKDELTERTTTVYKGPAIEYSNYEIEETDIRLKAFQHPLYRLEYPSVFNLVDENLADIPHHSSFETIVQFTVPQHNYISKSELLVIVEKPGNREYQDAAGKLDYWADSRDSADYLSIERTKIVGLPAYYMESHSIEFEGSGLEYEIFSRAVFFDYEDLIWVINMYWIYRSTVPPEVEEYFNHVIETFEILD
jgi:hypothetical protein